MLFHSPTLVDIRSGTDDAFIENGKQVPGKKRKNNDFIYSNPIEKNWLSRKLKTSTAQNQRD